MHLTREQVREIDRRAIEEYGVPGVVLMENAGRGAAELLCRLNPSRSRILILCGPGNNGGDGFVMARHLQNAGFEADPLLFGEMEQMRGDALVNARIWQRCGSLWTVRTDRPLDPDSARILEGPYGWIVDALFGTGLTRPLASPFDEVVRRLNSRERSVLAVDLPSGLDCDSGVPLGGLAVQATHTATFVALKQGFRNPEAGPWLGEVSIIDIGAPRKLIAEHLQS